MKFVTFDLHQGGALLPLEWKSVFNLGFSSTRKCISSAVVQLVSRISLEEKETFLRNSWQLLLLLLKRN